MIHTEQLCQDKAAAAQNRQRIANQDSIHEYMVQEHMRDGWEYGKPKPASLILGELPQIRAKRLHPFAIWRTSDE